MKRMALRYAVTHVVLVVEVEFCEFLLIIKYICHQHTDSQVSPSTTNSPCATVRLRARARATL